MSCLLGREGCMDRSGELFVARRKCYFGVYFPSYEATREINTKITLELERAFKHFTKIVYTLFHFISYIMDSCLVIKKNDSNTSILCPIRFVWVVVMTQSIVYDVTIAVRDSTIATRALEIDILIYIWMQYICSMICYYHCANLSEDIELIKCPSAIFCRVCE